MNTQQMTSEELLELAQKVMSGEISPEDLSKTDDGEPKSLSSDWRITKSGIQTVDMANALRSLRMIAGTLKIDVGKIQYASDGQSKLLKDHSLLEIDPYYATQNNPIKDWEFDILAGLVMHESGHALIQSEHVDTNPHDVANGIYSAKGIALVGEEIAADRLIQNWSKIYYRYLYAARNAPKYLIKSDIPDETYQNLLAVWIASGVYGHPVNWTKFDLKMKEAYGVLVELTKMIEDLQKLPREYDGEVSADASDYQTRLMLYNEAERKIADILKAANTPSERDKMKAPTANDPEFEQYKQDRKEQGVEQAKRNYHEKLADDFDKRDQDDDGDGDGELEDSPSGQNTQGEDQETTSSQIHESKDSQVLNPWDIKKPRQIKPAIEDFRKSTELERKANQELEARTADAINDLLPMHKGHDTQESISEELKEAIEEVIINETEDVTEKVKALMSEKWRHTIDNIMISNETDKSQPEIPPNRDVENELKFLTRVRNTADNIWQKPEDKGVISKRHLHRHKIDGRVYRKRIRRPDQRPEFVLLLDASGSMQARNKIYEAAAAVHVALPKSPIYTYKQGVELKRVLNFGRMRYPRTWGGTPSGESLLATLVLHPEASILHFTDGIPNQGRMLEDIYKIQKERFPKSRILNVIFGTQGRYSSFYNRDIDETYFYESDQVKNIRINKDERFSEILLGELRAWFAV